MWDAAAGEELKKFRTDRGWSQSRLAELIGVDQSTVSRIENGEAPNRAVRLHIDRLLAETEPPLPKSFGGAREGENIEAAA